MDEELTTSTESVGMIHYVCGHCRMEATMVITPVSALAWADHMDTHPGVNDFNAYVWDVLPLF
uniref:Uncharacterized protein n=1 Tax=uncultured prokaryote TaxID=198431 RepID=A0A0H5Q6A5_9ZZZZ|nr:hypothetical protein [uncultured prokaryote]